jgi:hypothetical protein
MEVIKNSDGREFIVPGCVKKPVEFDGRGQPVCGKKDCELVNRCVLSGNNERVDGTKGEIRWEGLRAGWGN